MAADDAVTGAIKLVKWLAGKGDDVVASAEDIRNYGPAAQQVRSLLNFLPTVSDEAAEVADMVRDSQRYNLSNKMYKIAELGYKMAPTRQPGILRSEVDRIVRPLGRETDLWRPASFAADAELVADALDPTVYRAITNPLAAGRAVDVLRTRPRLENTRFLDIARRAAERGAVSGPRDIVAVSRIAQAGEDVQEIALTLMGDGMPAEQAMRTARMLAQ